ncbi:hypothetical protein RRSWK_03735 [Rhodopirellula sp. SWK7]|nr:hypothetical protein RRSWK_03735 [Rhodopirellula sp. SWK7]
MDLDRSRMVVPPFDVEDAHVRNDGGNGVGLACRDRFGSVHKIDAMFRHEVRHRSHDTNPIR